MSTTIEFAVQMTCDKCVQSVENSLQGIKGVHKVDINLQSGSVVVDTTLSTEDVLKKLEGSGMKAVVKGYAGRSAAVAIMVTGEVGVQGVVRFIQVDGNTCVIDGTVDGLRPGEHGLYIHESGDISRGKCLITISSVSK